MAVLARRWSLAAKSGAAAIVLVCLTAILAAIVPLAPAGASSARLVRPNVLAPPPLPAGLHPLGALSPSQPISLEVELAPADPAALTSLLASQYNPASPEYQQWLAPGQFARQFAPSPGAAGAVSAWLDGLGLHTTRLSDSTIGAQGSSAVVSRGLGVSMARYREHDGAVVYAASQTPLVPASLVTLVSGALGLSNAPVETPQLSLASEAPAAERAQAAGPPVSACSTATQLASTDNGYTANVAGAHYGISTLIGDGADGTGQKVGVFELASSSATDLAAYQSCFDLHNQVSVVSVDGGGGSDPGGTQEADLDIEQVATQAPDATIYSYEGPNSLAGVIAIWQAIVNADTVGVISNSWGLCESEASDETSTVDPLLEQAAAQGQAIFSGSGDDGSEDCYDPPGDSDTSLAVDYPASNPWVTAVGGTALSLNGTEVVWNGCLGVLPPSGCDDSGAGGGGVSSFEAKPTWQSGLVTPAGFTCGSNGTNCREVPDISANAGVPEVFYAGGQWAAYTGTSVAAPMVAGLWADRQSACVHPAAGDAAALLYEVAASGGFGTAISDITQGENDFTQSHGGEFGAGAGYDLASGLGTPIGPGLACAEVTSVSPPQAPAGTQVTVNGLGLNNASISFGGATATVVSGSATTETVVVPSGSGAVNVTATGSLGQGTATASFTYGTPVGAFARVYGTTAIDTAIAISKARFPASDAVPAVVVARSDFFSDALAGGPLAARVGGPLLITPGASLLSTLDPTVLSEIERVLEPGGTVYLLGGPLALSPSIDGMLEGLGYGVTRVAGADEYATAVAIAQQLGNPSVIFEATGLNFPDALSAVPAAVEQSAAILLTDGTTQAPETATYLSAHPKDTRYAIGGPLAAAGADPSATAIYGQDQYGTSAAVAAAFFPKPTTVGAATGTNFPDGLAAGPGLGLADAPLLLVPPTGALPPTILTYLQAAGGTVIGGLLFGGPLAVADQVLAELDAAL
jgi:hypothetical protein